MSQSGFFSLQRQRRDETFGHASLTKRVRNPACNSCNSCNVLWFSGFLWLSSQVGTCTLKLHSSSRVRHRCYILEWNWTQISQMISDDSGSSVLMRCILTTWGQVGPKMSRQTGRCAPSEALTEHVFLEWEWIERRALRLEHCKPECLAEEYQDPNQRVEWEDPFPEVDNTEQQVSSRKQFCASWSCFCLSKEYIRRD